jgi:CofD-related protein of GAK system
MFRKLAGPDFDLRGASIGNLILTAGYLAHDRRIEPIVSVYSDLVRVRGKVGLVVDANLQIRARLKGGGHIIGQHLITGKEAPALTEAITELSLVEQGKADTPVRPGISASIRAAIAGADLICYPVGSFYSSLVANLLPAGVGTAVSRTPCPKVFIPNTLRDPESIGLSLSDQVRTLLQYLRADDPGAIASGDVLDHVLIDPDIAYPGCEDPSRDLAALGVQAIVTPLTSPATGAIDPHLLCRALISLT